MLCTTARCAVAVLFVCTLTSVETRGQENGGLARSSAVASMLKPLESMYGEMEMILEGSDGRLDDYASLPANYTNTTSVVKHIGNTTIVMNTTVVKITIGNSTTVFVFKSKTVTGPV
ncbi:uncharacterized protein [Ptychodera flava]|uniref:uncharacterized protein n=1 Tax=Ptychodera flava TaxID=63121 RepID=UPI00396A6667